jgi:hypothetical protein
MENNRENNFYMITFLFTLFLVAGLSLALVNLPHVSLSADEESITLKRKAILFQAGIFCITAAHIVLFAGWIYR